MACFGNIGEWGHLGDDFSFFSWAVGIDLSFLIGLAAKDANRSFRIGVFGFLFLGFLFLFRSLCCGLGVFT